MYRLISVNKDLADRTRSKWSEQIAARSSGILITHYERILDWADKFVTGKGDKDCFIYGLVCNDGSKHACAILEISHALPNSRKPWLKVLSVYLEPDLDVGDQDSVKSDILGRISGILGYSLVESLKLTVKAHPSNTLKVYARSDFAKGFFEALAAEVMRSDEIPGLRLSVQGRWLVFDLPKE